MCVTRNERGECTSKEPQIRHCCKMDYDQRCKALSEQTEEAIGKEIEKVTARLEELEKKLEELSSQLAELDKAVLNPSE